jgi:hypothetical protein
MIATDPLSLVFIFCFLVGLVFFIATALMGNLGHGASHHVAHVAHVTHIAPHAGSHTGTHTTHVAHVATHNGQGAHGQQAGSQSSVVMDYLNPTSVMLFLLGFGFFGYLFHNIVGFEAPLLALLAALLGGVVIAGLLLLALGRIFGNSEGATVQDVSDRTGLLGKVSMTIQSNGMGEVLYVSPGGMRKSIPARSIDGRRLERDEEVVVVNYQNGVAEVDTWDHFIHDEETYSGASDNLEELRSLLDQSSTIDQQQLAMHNELQKE